MTLRIIGERLRALRLERKERGEAESTLVEVSVAITDTYQVACSREHLTKVEGGKTLPSVPLLLALADYYRVSVDYLLGRTDRRVLCEGEQLSERGLERALLTGLAAFPEAERRHLEGLILSRSRKPDDAA